MLRASSVLVASVFLFPHLSACGSSEAGGASSTVDADLYDLSKYVGVQKDAGETPSSLDIAGDVSLTLSDSEPQDVAPLDACPPDGCAPNICTPDSAQCNADFVATCNADGTAVTLVDCAPGKCHDGACKCAPGVTACVDKDVHACGQDGASWSIAEACSTELGCLDGVCLKCYPGLGSCEGDVAVQCKDPKKGVVKVTCGIGETCILGKCVGTCGDAKDSNEGCDYWPVDLDNTDEYNAQSAQFAVVVSNPGAAAVDVEIRKKDDGDPEAQAKLLPGQIEVFKLPSYNVDGTMKGVRAWHLKATGPIVAYQFNPLDNIPNVHSNDASLLLPSNTWGTEYYAMTRKQLGVATIQNRGYFTVVAALPDTKVTVTLMTSSSAGTGVPNAIPKGVPTTFTLQPYEVLNIESNGPNKDLTGSRIASDKPVAVFGGHEASFSSEDCCADHLEHQLLPVSSWGTTYVATKSGPRAAEDDYWRILAAEDDTEIQTIPDQGPMPVLKQGEFFEVKSSKDFVIVSKKPIMVGQFLASSFEMSGTCPSSCVDGAICIDNGTVQMCALQIPCASLGAKFCPDNYICSTKSDGCEPIGDPSFILAIPVAQFRAHYSFLVPAGYAKNYVNIQAPAGAKVTLDGKATVALEVITGTTWAKAVVPLDGGFHTLDAPKDQAFGVVVYGFEDDVSYGYAGGCDVKKLQLEP